ncbi:patatin-like phospholipase family protein [Arenimonas composti]|uniref:patatin-like phospholipase family protein n=1 Tax=Arenimonas composti TaxID=370776 RepID=UPI000413C475|nr:patatin-like phospholipase family protein [Arenimonas composti]
MAVLALLATAPVFAADAGDDTPGCRRGATAGDDRPRIGLVLGGGGARGFAHVAVLKELERQRIPVDCIAGTSFGALVGGMYASGMSADEIEAALRGLDWGAMFEDDVARPHRSFRRKRDDDLSLLSTKPGIGNGGIRLAPGLLAGEQAMLMLERITERVATTDDFDDLPIPFRAVATDLNTGEAAVLGDGNLASAMRASLSIPGVFRPVARDGTFLVDGGLANQLPVDVVRAMGADIVIAVDVGSPLRRLDESAGPLDIVDQISGFMTVGSARAQIATLGPRDVLLRPDLGDEVTTDGFDQLETALRIGKEAMRAESERLAALALGRDDYRELAAARPVPADTPPVIAFVRLDNRSRYSDSMLLKRLDVPLGEPLDSQRVQAGLARIYGMDTLELATYDVVEEDGRAGLVVTVVPHGYGPNYLETGLSVYSDFNGDFWFSLRAGVLRAPWNDRGGELRGIVQLGDEPGLLVEAYQPVGTDGEWFLLGSASVESPRFSAYDADGERIATYRAPNWGGEISLGREYGNYGAALLTLRRREGHAELELGAPVVNELDYDQGEAELAVIFDRIDSTWLPRAGDYGSFTARMSRTALGGDADFEQYGLDLLRARALGKHSGFAGLRWHVSSDDPIPVPSQYRLGGLTRFAGYRPNERLADNYWLAYGGYTYELGRVWNRAAVLGATLEYGKAWDLLGDVDAIDPEIHGSLYFGFDSWLGPLQLGYGIREGGEGIFLLELGRPR